MDDQHGVIMDAMNELRLAVVRGSGREHVSELLNRLIEFTRMHFKCEEQLMERSEFPGLADHCAQHQSMLARLLHAARRMQYGEGVPLRALLCALRDGYIHHIEGLDRQYGSWLNERGMH